MDILIVGGSSRSLVDFRGPLIKEMVARGYEVVACAGEVKADKVDELKSWGIEFVPISLSRAAIRPQQDLRTLWQLFKLMRKYRPNTVLSYTIKPVIFCGLVGRLAGIKNIYSLISGLGYAFMANNTFRGRLVGVIAEILYKASLKANKKVFFQNPDDLQEFVDKRIVDKRKCRVVSGSGVDLDRYRALKNEKQPGKAMIFLLAARLLWTKGVGEYIVAARSLKQKYPLVRFQLAGSVDANPSSIGTKTLESWFAEGVVEYLGELEDVRPAYRDCHVYVLPSYREGTPRTVLEAMAIGRPIVTTDAPGCRETVKGAGREKVRAGKIAVGENGLLIPPRDAETLAAALFLFIESPDQVEKMGRASLSYVKDRYDVHKVNGVILQEMGL